MLNSLIKNLENLKFNHQKKYLYKIAFRFYLMKQNRMIDEGITFFDFINRKNKIENAKRNAKREIERISKDRKFLDKCYSYAISRGIK